MMEALAEFLKESGLDVRLMQKPLFKGNPLAGPMTPCDEKLETIYIYDYVGNAPWLIVTGDGFLTLFQNNKVIFGSKRQSPALSKESAETQLVRIRDFELADPDTTPENILQALQDLKHGVHD